MADLEIEGSFEEQWGIVKAAVKQHNSAINGNGQPGLLDFMSGIKGQMRLILALLSFLTAVAIVGTFLVGVHSMKVGRVEIPGFSHSTHPIEAYAIRKQDAQIPPLAR